MDILWVPRGSHLQLPILFLTRWKRLQAVLPLQVDGDVIVGVAGAVRLTVPSL